MPQYSMGEKTFSPCPLLKLVNLLIRVMNSKGSGSHSPSPAHSGNATVPSRVWGTVLPNSLFPSPAKIHNETHFFIACYTKLHIEMCFEQPSLSFQAGKGCGAVGVAAGAWGRQVRSHGTASSQLRRTAPKADWDAGFQY